MFLVFPTVYEEQSRHGRVLPAALRGMHRTPVASEAEARRPIAAEWRHVCDAHIVATAYQSRDDMGFEFADATDEPNARS
jgi:hypothetical protein